MSILLTLVVSASLLLIFTGSKDLSISLEKNDPMNNLINMKAREAASLKQSLKAWIASTRRGNEKPSVRSRSSATKGVSKENTDQLKALGYIEPGK